MNRTQRNFMAMIIIIIILKELRKEMHGYAIIEKINAIESEFLFASPGTIYPLLVRLQKYGILSSRWETIGIKRKRRYYKITPKGENTLIEYINQWKGLADVLQNYL